MGLTVKGWLQENLCGDGIVLYLESESGYSDLHVSQNDIELYIPCTIVIFQILILCYS